MRSLLALCLALAIPSLAAADLRVGTCKKEITPISPGLQAAYQAAFGVAGAPNHTNPVYMAGFGDNRQATGYHDRLWARGVVVDRNGKRVAIVSVDLIGYFKNEIDTIRGMVSPSSEVDFVLVASTHQHEGPDTIGIWGANALSSGIDYGYLDFVNATVADCIDEAAASLEKARVYYATAQSDGLSIGTDPEDDGFGVSDGKVLAGDAALAPATQGRIVDPNIAIMQLTKRQGSNLDVLATLVNFGSHPESLGSNNTLITSDFPHYVRERIEAAVRRARDLDVGRPGRSPGAARHRRAGSRHEGGRAAAHLPVRGGARHAARGARDHGDRRGAPQERQAESEQRRSLAQDRSRDGRSGGGPARQSVLPVLLRDRRARRAALALHERSPRPVGRLPFPPPFDSIPQALRARTSIPRSPPLRIGDGAIAVVPTELDPQIGSGYRQQLEDATGAEHTFIAGLGNDEIGYQVPFAKWDNSCHACAPYFILGGVPQFCPIFPNIDCNTVFQNNVGQQVDPTVTEAFDQAVDDL